MHQGWVLLYSNPTLISNPGSDGFVEKIRENIDWETDYKAKDQKRVGLQNPIVSPDAFFIYYTLSISLSPPYLLILPSF